MFQTPSMVVTYVGIGLCTCLLILVVNPRLEGYLYAGPHLGRFSRNHTTRQGTEADPSESPRDTPARKNVLFIIVDDLRPQLGAYHDPDNPDYFSRHKISTPNLDGLAARSLLLRHAYVQQSLCGPSRTSMLTSRRPDVTRAFSNDRYWRNSGGNFTTLPQFFKENGYVSLGFGKVYHTGASSNKDDRISWTEKFYKPPFSDSHYVPKKTGAGWSAVEDKDRERVPLTDDSTVQRAIETLDELAPAARSGQQPFFLAVGFRKPHLSYVCPKEFYSLYPLEEGDQFLVDKSWQTPIVKKACGVSGTEVDGETVIPDDALRHLRRAYFACISYADHNVGLLLKAVDRLGLAESTVVSFVADHGYHLGENNHWGKMETYELSTRVPMIIHIPGMTNSGVVSDSLVEALDLYPTLVEAAGLDPVPRCPVRCSNVAVCTQGQSLFPLIEHPRLELRDAAFSQVTAVDDTRYTLRTPRYRYVEKAKGSKELLEDGRYKYQMMWDTQGLAAELYDHDSDPYERFNVIDDPRYMKDRALLRNKLHDFVAEMYIESKRI